MDSVLPDAVLWLRTVTQASATFLISKSVQAGLRLSTLYVYALIYNLIKLYGPKDKESSLNR